jgi:hypothetical protein
VILLQVNGTWYKTRILFACNLAFTLTDLADIILDTHDMRFHKCNNPGIAEAIKLQAWIDSSWYDKYPYIVTAEILKKHYKLYQTKVD